MAVKDIAEKMSFTPERVYYILKIVAFLYLMRHNVSAWSNMSSSPWKIDKWPTFSCPLMSATMHASVQSEKLLAWKGTTDVWLGRNLTYQQLIVQSDYSLHSVMQIGTKETGTLSSRWMSLLCSALVLILIYNFFID